MALTIHHLEYVPGYGPHCTANGVPVDMVPTVHHPEYQDMLLSTHHLEYQDMVPTIHHLEYRIWSSLYTT